MFSVFTEITCIGILVLIFLQPLIHQQKFNFDDYLYASFYKLVISAFICTSIEAVAVYMLINRADFSLISEIGILELYFNSFLVCLIVAFLHIMKLLNSDLPSLKRIGNWPIFFLGFMFFAINIVTLASLRISGEKVSFEPYIVIVYIMVILIEVVAIGLCLINRKYINRKRMQITAIGFFVHLLSLGVQIFNPDLLFLSVSVLFIVVTLQMTLENEDVKLLKQLENETIIANEANQAKSDFIANVSHQIRTPINAVLGLDEMILRESGDSTIRQYAADIKSAAQTLHSLINEILDLSKVGSGKMEILNVNYNMRSLINDTVNIIQMRIDSKKLKFIVNVSPDMPAGYYGDDIRIKQVLMNILSNAVKYTETGAVNMNVTYDKISDKKVILHFSIEDTGIGMTKESLEALFDEFSRFDSDKNRNVEGTGLGMSITMKLIKLMGSELKVTSEYGRGSCFSFDLEQTIWDSTPLGDFRTQSYEKVKEYTYENSFEAPETKVLVVDDNAINRKVFKGLLKATKLLIDEAESGPECLNMITKNKYKIVFMDHMMPDMDGIETFHRMQDMENNLSKDAVVIMLTANAVNGAKEEYIKEGFDDFMSKPIVPEKLEEMIKKYI